MAASFATLSFLPRAQRPISFVHYSGPKAISTSAPIRASGDSGAIDNSLVEPADACPPRETAEPSGPVSRGSPIVIADDACFEIRGATEQGRSERSATDEVLAERRVTTDADQVATSQARNSISPSMDSDDAELDYLFNSPIKTQDPVSPTRSSRSGRSRSLSESDLDLDISDYGSPHISGRRSRKRRMCSYPEQSGEPLSFQPLLAESSIPAGTSKEHKRRMCGQDRPLDHSGPTFLTPNNRFRRQGKSRGSFRSSAEGVFAHRMRLRDRNTRATPQKINNVRTSLRDPHSELAPREPCGTRDTSIASRLDRSTSCRMDPGSHAQEQFGRGACNSLVSPAPSASISSDSLAMAQIQSVITACQSGQSVARDMCIQSISPELSFLIFILPDTMSLKALMYPQEGQDSTGSLGCYGGLENVIVKQIQSTMWLVAGTVRNFKVSCSEPNQKVDFIGSANEEVDSANENVSDYCSNSSGGQFFAKNQRWSQEDDRILCEWVGTGRPWSWIIRQFPMRTPGSVRTRYSMLRRKSTQP
ncbi:hypothetical protein B0J12DRAFT_704069 [Macrophomina phaseolina]|uniref:Myb-like domain-containing protein n=1 Tax=Macrophomina phaseolina TaxID=35725 RepID=A0ABQ8FWC6_9PEZI|nr:hypothetical protein B0J12DRAFT_704069 [Macrophomina phaseolina]